MMADIIATQIELIVYNYLTAKKIPFEFQSSQMGGWYSLGGSVIDFLLPELRLAFRVQGEYWHRGVSKGGQDLIQRERLSAMGLTVVDLWTDDILDPDRLEQAMRLALQGQEQLR